MKCGKRDCLLKGLLLGGLWCFAASQVGAQISSDPPWNVRLVGQIGGWCLTVEFVGHYAYMGEGPNLRILDVSNPSLPVPIGNVWLGDFWVYHIRVKNTLAYVAGGELGGFSGLKIADVANPRSPRLLGSFPTPYQATGVCVTNGLAYVAYGDVHNGSNAAPGGVRIVDVSIPSSPSLRGSFDTGTVAYKTYVTGGIAYVATRGGLYIYDVTNPAAARRLSIAYSPYCNDVYVRGNLAYSAYGSGLQITDVTSPSAPARRGWLYWGASDGLALQNNLVFLVDPIRGLNIVDVTNPWTPTSVGSLPTSGMAYSLAVSSGTAYVACGGGGLSIVDVRNPTRPTLRGSYDTLSGANEVQVVGNVAYVANGQRGFKTVDVSNPRLPRILGALRTPIGDYEIAVSRPFIYLTGVHGRSAYYGLQIVDVTTPSLPRLRGSYGVQNTMGDVAVSGGLAYVAQGDYGLRIVDVTNPSSPTSVALYDTPDYVLGVFVSGCLAYLADSSRFRILDVRNPAAPVMRSVFTPNPPHFVEDVCISNGIAFLRGEGQYSEGFVTCVDVRNPDAPRFLSKYQSGTGTYYGYGGLHATDGYVYAGLDALRILDVRDPTRPTLRGFYPAGFDCRPFAVGDLIYVASVRGLRIFQFTGRVSAADRQWQLYR